MAVPGPMEPGGPVSIEPEGILANTKDAPLLRSLIHLYRSRVPLRLRETIYIARQSVAASQKFLSGNVLEIERSGVRAKMKVESTPAYVHTARLDYERTFFNDFLRTIHPGDIVYDVGAAQGLYTIFPAILHPTAWVYAFEPFSPFVKELRENVFLNNLSNVTILELGLSDTRGEFELFHNGKNGSAPSTRNSESRFKQTQLIKLVTVDELVLNGTLPPPDIAKIDAEGAESDILAGMQWVLANHPPRHLFVEFHNTMISAFNTEPTMFLNRLIAQGYKVPSEGATLRGESNLLIRLVKY